MSSPPHLDWIAGASVHGVGWIVVLAAAAWLLLGEPLLGRASCRRLVFALDRRVAHARLRCYAVMMESRV